MRSTAILYDADCGFCTWALGKILAWDRRHCLRPVALQDPEADELLGGMDEDRKMASWHLVTPDGEVHSGGDGFEPLAALLPGGATLGRLARACPRARNSAYRFVADHRSWWGKLTRHTNRDATLRRIERARLG
jgi:predicted DCC family thiol-disulfide oxidoreductase YuxK